MSANGLHIDIACRELVELVTDYLEGQLDEGLAAAVAHHLTLCPGCDRYLDQMRETIASLGRVPVESLSAAARAELVVAFADFPRSAPGATGR